MKTVSDRLRPPSDVERLAIAINLVSNAQLSDDLADAIIQTILGIAGLLGKGPDLEKALENE